MSLYSMTAYGYGENKEKENSYVCEIRTLNSRFLEVNVRLPKFLMALETEIMAEVKKAMQRGKVDVFFGIHVGELEKSLPLLNRGAVRHYLEIIKELREEVKALSVPGVSLGDEASEFCSFRDLLRFEGVLQNLSSLPGYTQNEVDAHRPSIFKALTAGLVQIDKTRRAEGAVLEKALNAILDEIENESRILVGKVPEIRENLYQNYLRRLETFLDKLKERSLKTAEHLSEDRLHLEVGIIAEKSDIDEELTRLQGHVKEFRSQIQNDETVGRRLDFLCQEMHREINTVSSKLVQSDVSKQTLNLKQAVERLRQQVQNIE